MGLNIDYMLKTLVLALRGIPTTLGITLVSLLIAAPIAFFIAISKIYSLKGVHQVTTVYTSFIRGTPIVLQILLIYSLLPSLLNVIVKRIGLDFNVFDLNPIIYACIIFSFNTSAGLSEIFRSSLLTINRGQMEAAYSVGMTTVQAYRRLIIPQALVVALPNICNLTINLIKGTSLAFLMTVKDITAIAKIEAAYGYNYIESYIDIFIIYILICSLTQLLFTAIEKRVSAFKSLRPA
jgi:L-cystine transport system permease protein